MAVREKLEEIARQTIGGLQDRDFADDVELESWGLDSLDFIELVMEIENEYVIDVPDDILVRAKTFGELVKYIEGAKSAA